MKTEKLRSVEQIEYAAEREIELIEKDESLTPEERRKIISDIYSDARQMIAELRQESW